MPLLPNVTTLSNWVRELGWCSSRVEAKETWVVPVSILRIASAAVSGW